jgi:hypothetical protein
MGNLIIIITMIYRHGESIEELGWRPLLVKRCFQKRLVEDIWQCKELQSTWNNLLQVCKPVRDNSETNVGETEGNRVRERQ